MKPVRHYLDTILRADESVIATNIGLKTSYELAFISRGRSIKCELCDLYYVSNHIAKRLADGCPCMLVPWHTASSGSFKIMSSHSYFEILQLMYRSCPRATETRSQDDGVMVHPLLV